MPEAEEATGMHAAVKINKTELHTVLATVLQGIFPQLSPDKGRNLPDLTLFVQLQPSLLSSIRPAWSLSPGLITQIRHCHIHIL